MYQNFIIPYLYEAQHVSSDTPPIIRSLKLHWQPLVFHTWEAVGRVDGGRCQAQCAWQRPPSTRPTTFHVWKTRGCQCSFKLLMIGGVSLETCWASYKYGIIKVWYIVASCWIFIYDFYYDARIHEHQVSEIWSKMYTGRHAKYQLFLSDFNPLNPELNPICYLLALLAHHFLHVSRIRVKSLTIRLLMSYIYIWSAYSWCF